VRTKLHINYWFLYPCLLWVIASAIILINFSSKETFQFINTAHSDGMDTLMPFISMLGEGILFGIVLIVLIFRLPRNQRVLYFIWASSSIMFTSVISHILKNWNSTPRPMTLWGSEAWFHHLSSWPDLYQKSFPSAHTSSAFALLFIISVLLPIRYRVYGLHCFLLALMVAWSRLYLAAHVLTDVVTGSFIGVVVPLVALLVINRIGSSSKKLNNVPPDNLA